MSLNIKSFFPIDESRLSSNNKEKGPEIINVNDDISTTPTMPEQSTSISSLRRSSRNHLKLNINQNLVIQID